MSRSSKRFLPLVAQIFIRIAFFAILFLLQTSSIDPMYANSGAPQSHSIVSVSEITSHAGTSISPEDQVGDDAISAATAIPTSWPTSSPQIVPRNIIIMIGDGMGVSHVDAASMYKYGEAGAMAFEYAPHQAEMTTFAANNKITDSAASASAMATGRKINNRVVSLAIPGDGSELETSLEYFRDRCKATGLVTTANITHATPASFGAHATYRYSYSEIAGVYFTQTRPNLLFGGTEAGVTRQTAEAAGYQVITDRSEMLAIGAPSNPADELFVSGQFGFGHLAYEFDYATRVSNFYDTKPHLSEMAETALDLLEDSPDGFFLLIESGRIDHAAHSNLSRHNIFETIELENTFRKVIEWMTGREDTLLILVADHETGGLFVEQNNGQGNFPQISWASTKHTAENVPVYAWGPNAQMVTDTIDNTDIHAISIAGSEPDPLCLSEIAPTPAPAITAPAITAPVEISTPVPNSTSGSLLLPETEDKKIEIAARIVDERPSISWLFTSDRKTQWFNIYRTQSPSFEQAQKVNSQPIPAPKSGTNNYRLQDDLATTEIAYYYWIEQLLAEGQIIRSGPQTLIIEKRSGHDNFYLPLINMR